MNTRDIEEMSWAEQELAEAFVSFVRRHRRSPSRDDLERLRLERFSAMAAWGL